MIMRFQVSAMVAFVLLTAQRGASVMQRDQYAYLLCSARIRPDGRVATSAILQRPSELQQHTQVFEAWGGKEQPSKQIKSPVLLPRKGPKTRQAAPGEHAMTFGTS